MATDKKISQLNPASAFTGAEKFEIVQGGLNLAATPEQMRTYIGAGPTREFDRTWSAELLFDKNEIEYGIHTLTGDLTYTVASTGHITDQFSTSIQTIITDGTRVVTFGPGIVPLGDFQSGSIPEAGTYYVIFTHWNGNTLANWTHPSIEVATLEQLPVVADFAATVVSDTAIDLDWTDSANEASYEIQYSDSGGGGPWNALATPAQNAITYSATGLTASTTYHFRIRAVGDGLSFATSNWVVVASTTSDAGDVAAPVPTFAPINTATDFPVNKPIVITWDEATQNTDASEITNANIASLITLKETNGAGANIAFTATIDVTKTIWTITPATMYGVTQLVYLEIAAVEDVNGNTTAGHNITFTTGEMTFFNGTSNMMLGGDVLNSLFSAANTNFRIEITLGDPSLSGVHRILSKVGSASNASDKTFSIYTSGSNVLFFYYMSTFVPMVTPLKTRNVRWTNALSAGEHDYAWEYDGSIDTNDGLDRVILEIDTVVQTTKDLVASDTLGTLDDDLNSNTTQLAVGNNVDSGGSPVQSQWFDGLAKGLKIYSNNGATLELDIPVLYTGTDVSGNGRNGTWV